MIWIFLACSPAEPTRAMAASCSATKPSTKALCSAPTPWPAPMRDFFRRSHLWYSSTAQRRCAWTQSRHLLVGRSSHALSWFSELGQQPLVDALSDGRTSSPSNQIRDHHHLQAAISAEQTVAAFEQTELASEMYEHPLGTAWPSLITLIGINKG